MRARSHHAQSTFNFIAAALYLLYHTVNQATKGCVYVLIASFLSGAFLLYREKKMTSFFVSAVLISASVVMESLATPVVLDLTVAGTSMPMQIAVQTCSGLLNRDTAAGGVYTLLNQPWDDQWLSDVDGIVNPEITPLDSFLASCLARNDIVKGYILYDYKAQQALIPNIVTLASVLDGVPLEASDPNVGKYPLLFDATTEWTGYTPLDVSLLFRFYIIYCRADNLPFVYEIKATKYMYDRYVNNTSTLAWLNPGYDNKANATNPPLTQSPNPGLIDYTVKERIFNFYLNDACIPGTPDYEFMTTMTTTNPWPRPIPVYGYGDTYPIAGDIFEAETDCTKVHNMGQIASVGVNNLAYFSRRPEITTTIHQNPVAKSRFEKTKTYFSFVIGDGDNLAFLKSSRRSWMIDRVSRCQADPSYLGCFPLSWSISPHPRFLAPDWLSWYYNQSYLTGNDFFILPPSGDLYSYPSEMPADVQASYVTNTERDCELLETSGVVAWEWFGHWNTAVTEYFPQYSANKILRGVFPVNVPFNVPMIEVFKSAQDFKMIADNVVLFRPREWRGDTASNIPVSHREYLTVDQMATEINHLPRGTISWLYLTSDGGGSLQMIYDLVAKLYGHVEVVSHETLTNLAIERGERA